MSQDHVGNRNFHELFKEPVRFVVPFFQRGYAWQRRQWDDLFGDLNDQVLAEIERGTPVEAIEHFFGPVVVQSRTVPKGTTPEFLIIDGQQRITTIYVLLGIIGEHLARRQHDSMEAALALERLKPYLENKTKSKDDYVRLKVFSSKGDRLSTYRAMFGATSKPESDFYASDADLYRAGASMVEEFAKYVERRFKYQFNDTDKLWRLAQAALHCLKIVWIPLDEEKDDPQSIFESLNDRGMPLTSSELICSYLFRPLMAGEDFEALHNDFWLAAIKEIGPGPNFEDYLRCLYSIGERSMVGAGRKTYVHFKMKHRGLSSDEARDHLAAIRSSVAIFNFIANPEKHLHPDPECHQFLSQISETRMDSCSPFLLCILREHNEGKLTLESLRSMLRETLVQLVRRKWTELASTAYDKLFPNLYSRIAKSKNLAHAMHEQFRKHGVFVNDFDFSEAVERKPLYRARDLNFGRMVMVEIDRKLQGKARIPDYAKFKQIDHVVPQELDRRWKEYLGSDWRDDQMAVAVNTLGNLCLAIKIEKPGESRDPFAAKCAELYGDGALARQFLRHKGKFDLAAIRKRSKALAKEALEIWKWGE